MPLLPVPTKQKETQRPARRESGEGREGEVKKKVLKNERDYLCVCVILSRKTKSEGARLCVPEQGADSGPKTCAEAATIGG